MTTEEEKTIDKPKKKRGRHKKENPYADFQPEVKEVFKGYLEDNKNLIESFCYNEEERISQDLWNRLYNHLKMMDEKLDDNYFRTEYHYRTKSQWRVIDTIRENDRKRYAKGFYEKERTEDNYTYLAKQVYIHMKLYVVESSKEMNV